MGSKKQVFDNYYQVAMAMQHGALTTAVGCMRMTRECDPDLFAAAQSELRRFRRETVAFWQGRTKSFEPVNRELLSRAWADWQVAQIVKVGALAVAGAKS